MSAHPGMGYSEASRLLDINHSRGADEPVLEGMDLEIVRECNQDPLITSLASTITDQDCLCPPAHPLIALAYAYRGLVPLAEITGRLSRYAAPEHRELLIEPNKRCTHTINDIKFVLGPTVARKYSPTQLVPRFDGFTIWMSMKFGIDAEPFIDHVLVLTGQLRRHVSTVSNDTTTTTEPPLRRTAQAAMHTIDRVTQAYSAVRS